MLLVIVVVLVKTRKSVLLTSRPLAPSTTMSSTTEVLIPDGRNDGSSTPGHPPTRTATLGSVSYACKFSLVLGLLTHRPF